jgi:hypothetical protein
MPAAPDADPRSAMRGWHPNRGRRVETPVAIANGSYDIECVVNQPVHMVTGVIGRIRSSACGISPLVRGYGVVAGLPHSVDLRIPEEPRHAEPRGA